MLPISHVLLALSERYIQGLTDFRGDYDPAGLTANEAPEFRLSFAESINRWLRFFFDAADKAVDLALELIEGLRRFEEDVRHEIIDSARRSGKREPRADATIWQVIDVLPRLPILTPKIAAELTGATDIATRNALKEIESLGFVDEQNIHKGRRGFVCKPLLNLLNISERKWASTAFDTSVSPPIRSVPGKPGANK